MKKVFFAVMHVNSNISFTKVLKLIVRVIKALGDNAATYPAPNPTIAALDPESTKLKNLIGEAKGNSQKVAERNDQSRKVFSMLKEELVYVNQIAQGDKAIILLSGFDASNEPSPSPMPSAIVIKRIENGSVPLSAKVFIIPDKATKNYVVQTSNNPKDEESWKTVMQPTSSRKIEITKLSRGSEISIRIAGNNASGQGNWSNVVSFIPQ